MATPAQKCENSWLMAALVAPTAPRDTVKTPQGLQALIDDGVIDEVLRPLKSGKGSSGIRCPQW
jgi:hypothetical protein